MEILHYADKAADKALCGEVDAVYDDGEEIGEPCQACLKVLQERSLTAVVAYHCPACGAEGKPFILSAPCDKPGHSSRLHAT